MTLWASGKIVLMSACPASEICRVLYSYPCRNRGCCLSCEDDIEPAVCSAQIPCAYGLIFDKSPPPPPDVKYLQ